MGPVVLLDSPAMAAGFQPLTFPRLRPALLSLPAQVLAVGVHLDGRPVGLALGAAGLDGAKLDSVMVDKSVRRAGLGSELVAGFERHAVARGATSVATSYSSRLPERAAFEALLRRGGWEAPELALVRASGHPSKILDWAATQKGGRRLVMEDAYTVVGWDLITDADRAAIERIMERPDSNPDFHPFKQSIIVEPATSFVLHRFGEVVGWLLSERVDDRTIFYHCAYMLPEFQRQGRLLSVFIETHRRQAALLGPDSVWQITTNPAVTPFMAAFVSRRLAEHSEWVDEMWRSKKVF